MRGGRAGGEQTKGEKVVDERGKKRSWKTLYDGKGGVEKGREETRRIWHAYKASLIGLEFSDGDEQD